MVDEPKSNMPAQLLNGHSKPDGFLVVGVGASAGGVSALEQFFNQLKSDCGMAFVVILRLAPQYESKPEATSESYPDFHGAGRARTPRPHRHQVRLMRNFGPLMVNAVTSLTTFAEAERELIARALRRVADNKVHAARLLGISRKKLYAKIAKYGLAGDNGIAATA